ncbi:MAG: EH signature domain-containing protein [Alphaproteobacteria bacterium]
MTGAGAASVRPPALATLEAAFTAFKGGVPGKEFFGQPEKMLEVEEKLRKSVQPGTQMPERAVCKSVAAFHAKGADRLTSGQLRALCAGLNHSCKSCGTASLMESPHDAAQDFFSRLRHAFREKRLEIESWYDLVQAYLAAREKTVCCEMLRDFLDETLPAVSGKGPYPFTWLPALTTHRDILSDTPCKAVAQQSLRGETRDTEDLRRALGIPDGSWYWKELASARAAEAAQLDDAAFTAALPPLLQCLHFLSHRSRDAMLRLFLDRYMKCRDAGVNEDLRSFIVDYWGSPALGSDPKYDSVSPEARHMVEEWLVRDDMKDFFTLLPAGVPDERKLSFWSRYMRSIDYHRLLLGSLAQASPQPVVAQLRRRPSVGKLIGAVDTDNALLFKIGNWLLVETGGNETPLFGYRIAKLPFNPDGEIVDLPCLKKGATADFKILRQDTLEGMWEDRVTTELATLGIRRDEGATAKRKAPTAKNDAPPPAAHIPFDSVAFQALLRDGSLQAEDTRDKGGMLWVVNDLKDNFYVAQKLAGWGFRWKAGRGWWKN